MNVEKTRTDSDGSPDLTPSRTGFRVLSLIVEEDATDGSPPSETPTDETPSRPAIARRVDRVVEALRKQRTD